MCSVSYVGERALTVLRFAVVSPDGRRSCEWRVWTGGKKPTNEVYMAQRSMGSELKVSIHSDGWCQHGLTGELRGSLRPDDSHVLDRWRLGSGQNGWHAPYEVWFPESKLDEAEELDQQTTRIGSAAPGRAIIVGLFVSAADAAPEPWGAEFEAAVVGRLKRAGGGSVVVMAFEKDFDDLALSERLKVRLGASWELPRPLSERTFGWLSFNTEGDTRGVVEFSANRSELPAEDQLPVIDFAGMQRPWDDLPDWLRDRTDLCAVLACAQDAVPVLFVDTRARCLHADLGPTADALYADFQAGRIDEGWDEVAPGILLTGIVTQATIERRDERL